MPDLYSVGGCVPGWSRERTEGNVILSRRWLGSRMCRGDWCGRNSIEDSWSKWENRQQNSFE